MWSQTHLNILSVTVRGAQLCNMSQIKNSLKITENSLHILRNYRCLTSVTYLIRSYIFGGFEDKVSIYFTTVYQEI